MGAAFVNIGESRDGFLALPEIRPLGKVSGTISDFAKEGESILVQVQRDPIEEKGVKLTCHIHLAGAFLIFRPYQKEVTVSRRILDKDKRIHLKEIASKFLLKGGGFIVRTNADGATDKQIEEEAIYLISYW